MPNVEYVHIASHHWLKSVFYCAAATLLVTAAPAAAEVAGRALDVRPSATLSNGEGSITLSRGADVAMGDRVRTNSRGQVQLKFTDDTKLVVGPNSSLVIEAYLLRSRNRANNFTVRALGGTFRMISGNSQKQAYRIRTPTATIGIRGTSFDLAVSGGETNLLLYSGSARICGSNGRCRIIEGRCSLGQAPRRGNPDVVRDRRAAANIINRQFLYARSQNRLHPEFRVRQTGCGQLARLPLTPDRRTRQVPQVTPAPSIDPPSAPAPAPEPQSRGNRGHGNGDEGDAQGSAGNDPDNPGRGGGSNNGGNNGNNGNGNNGRGGGQGRS